MSCISKCECDLEQEVKKYGRPMHMEEMPSGPIYNPLGWSDFECKDLDAEAALRMLRNNLHPKVALDWEKLVVYGGSGRAARNWREYHRIIEALKDLNINETLCVQSGKPVYVFRSYTEAPRVLIANSNIVSHWDTQENFDEMDRLGLMMYGQMTAGSWIYIGTQGILQGTYETMAACAKKEFGQDSLRGKFVLSAGMGAMSGAQPMAVTMNEGVLLCVEPRVERIQKKIREGYCDRMTFSIDEALQWVEEARDRDVPMSVGLVGNAADIYYELVEREAIPDVVTDQTSAHDLLSYVPYVPKLSLADLDEMRVRDPDEYKKLAQTSIRRHVLAILEMQRQGAVCIDYGNNLRGQAEAGEAGIVVRDSNGEFLYPGFVQRYIRPLFCEGKGPFRWVALSGEPQDIWRIDRALIETFPQDEALHRWIRKAQEQVPFIGLPARICWLGYEDRARFGLVINHLVRNKALKGPIVIGRDHLDCGSVASPNRETEGMPDKSDAVADWAMLNAMGNVACGASWVSIHGGGGVGVGHSQHAGMVIVADGTRERDRRLERVLTFDPGIGVARHVDAGYERAKQVAQEKNLIIPH